MKHLIRVALSAACAAGVVSGGLSASGCRGDIDGGVDLEGGDASSDPTDASTPGPDGGPSSPDASDSPTSDASGSPDAAPSVCEGNCYYVRADASGAADGSDWANAFTDLPATLARGHLYWIATGDYAGRTIDPAASGTELVEIHRATAASHGTEVGWQAAYAQGVARFGPLEIAAPYVLLDGGAGRGVEVRAGYQGSTLVIDADWVTVRNLDLDGAFGADGGGYHTSGACTGLSIRGSNVEVSGCEIHDAADDGVSITHSSHVSFIGNEVHRLHGCGTDGECGPCYNGHSDGIETYNVSNSEFVGNLIYDMASTSAFFFGGWADELGNGPSEYCLDILLANNILYSPDTGFVAYLQDVGGLRLYHNVIWGIRSGRYGGLAIGDHVTDLDLYNNVILSINYEHMGSAYDAVEHRGDYNLFGVSLGQYTEAANDIVNADPGFAGIPDMNGPQVGDPTATDFLLTTGSPCIDEGYAGDATILLPTTDFFGTARDATPDIGAVEATSG